MTEGVKKIDIARPSLGNDEWQALREPIESGWLTQGPKVQAFETAFAERHTVSHALATTSCTTALHLALAALDIGPGDEVIVPSFTWVATANVVIYCGATPVLVDIDAATMNIDIAAVAAAITPNTRAIIPVHLFGLCADINALREVLPDHVKIIEDAACAAGANYHGTPAGGLGDAAAFSFHPRKSITTGEGGMLTTNDDAIAEIATKMRNHGAAVPEEIRVAGPKPYLLPDFEVLGFNYRMTDLQGAVGLVQLGKLDTFIDERAKWAAWYRERLAGLEWLQLPDEPIGGRHAWQAFVTQVDPKTAPSPRNVIMETLEAAGIATRPGTHAVHMLGYYQQRFSYIDDSFPASRAAAENSLALPLHNLMSKSDFIRIADALENV